MVSLAITIVSFAIVAYTTLFVLGLTARAVRGVLPSVSPAVKSRFYDFLYVAFIVSTVIAIIWIWIVWGY